MVATKISLGVILGVIMFTFLRERVKLMSINVVSLFYTTCLRRLLSYVEQWLFAFCNNSCGGWMRRVMVEGGQGNEHVRAYISMEG